MRAADRDTISGSDLLDRRQLIAIGDLTGLDPPVEIRSDSLVRTRRSSLGALGPRYRTRPIRHSRDERFGRALISFLEVRRVNPECCNATATMPKSTSDGP